MPQLEETKSTELLDAVRTLNMKEIVRLIEAGADINAKDKNERTPLHAAAEHSSTKAVKVLIEAGADINAKDKNERTPLHIAAVKGYTEIVKVLIDLGADINAKDKNKKTPLHRATEIGFTDICEVILNHIARLEVAGLYVSEENLQKKNEFITTSTERYNNYLQHLKNCEEEVKKIKERNKSLYDFLRENDVNKMAGIWEQNENVRNEFDNEENLKKLYPEYAHILINKADEVKKEIFLHNNKPLVDFLSTHYRYDFQKAKFFGMERFFEVHKNDFKEERVGVRNNTLFYFVDFNVEKRYAPKLKLQAFVETIGNEGVNSNLHHPNTEQTQGASQSLN
ncbi:MULTISPECIES: ankyrin repeat domain-containing protein [Wolbachia]|uniref:ankyrin repeat domain-containing protein n=1 Tax=Wolbachia TaxID=953 RepID=UPI001E591B4D|nr:MULTISPECIES: ankyrin repeat domain-containing protein [unclassified Wolbachia]UFO00367.1 ankyrin repeat domain-containing protein [Wolbachia endosymbiont of Corcyra cephalonica]